MWLITVIKEDIMFSQLSVYGMTTEVYSLMVSCSR